MRGRVVKWGNSLAVRVPKTIADEARLKAGDSVEIEVDDSGSVQLYRRSKIPTLAQLVSQITPENRYEEVRTGPAVGRESIEW